MTTAPLLEGVEALLFDVFGTVVDWLSSVTKELEANSKGVSADWLKFAKQWRAGYIAGTRRVAAGGEGPSSIDVMHRQILDAMLQEPEWTALSELWNEEEKKDLVNSWHRLKGWSDAAKGLYALKERYLICTLSNGNVRLLADMAKHSDLPWDIIFSGELLGSYKPNPKVYLGAAYHLSIPPTKCALVAAHIGDLRAAASHGYKTVYVRRPTEDSVEERSSIQSKSQGGEVDLAVDSFLELAELLSSAA